ncbi:MAG: MarR family transcriptional regulator [Pseudomonadota bacterium]
MADNTEDAPRQPDDEDAPLQPDDEDAPRQPGDEDAPPQPGDERLKKGIEAMFFAYRGFTADPDRILAKHGFGRAHHRAIHFINRSPRTTVNNLLSILGVTKQSLNRVLRTLIDKGLVESEVGTQDRRERHLSLTEAGLALEAELSTAQEARVRAAYAKAGPGAVAGFEQVLEAMMDRTQLRHYTRFEEDTGGT